MTRQEFEDITALLATILFATEFDGHVYAVGGSVRDYIMGKEIKDIDLVVDLPDGGIRLAEYLYKYKHLLYEPVMYPAYGTCQFRIKSMPDIELEAVHTRGEQYHLDSRNPETCFADINTDATRRDLTINALYYDIFLDKIVDPTGKGLDDIKNHIIRTSNTDSDVVFNDDPLRILRVIRFASRFRWNIDADTIVSMKKFIPRLDIISRERITAEYMNMLKNGDPVSALSYLYIFNLCKIVCGTVYSGSETEFKEKILKPIELCRDNEYTLNTKLAVIYLKEKPETVYNILHELKFDTKTAEAVSKLVKYAHCFDDNVSAEHIRKIQLKWNKDGFYDLLDLLSAIGYPQRAEMIKSFIEKDGYNMFEYKLPINGDEIMSILNCESGKKIGDIINTLYSYACKKPSLSKQDMILLLTNMCSQIKN